MCPDLISLCWRVVVYGFEVVCDGRSTSVFGNSFFVGGGGSEVMDHKKVVHHQSYDITFHKYIIFDEDNRNPNDRCDG